MRHPGDLAGVTVPPLRLISSAAARRGLPTRVGYGPGFQQPETHLPLPSNSMVRSLIARWAGALTCFMSAAVWVFAFSLPPSVAASFTCVKITEAGLSRSLMAYAPDWNMQGFGPRLITARLALWKSLMTVFMSPKTTVSPDR